MNESLQSFILKLLISAGTAWATRQGLAVDGSTIQAIAGGIVAFGAAAFGIFAHWGMKKVPVNSIAVDPASLGIAASQVKTVVAAATQFNSSIPSPQETVKVIG